ncbi:hypothetical protein BOTBODRAFT_48453 [Botryobasidium botryosum FD-172 SS1]|uniref:Uncharacterized protein n=1 Tax=Botryobasidium botryosum (strain FD-172 SS1) TaxID=930990 RepID=A0A067M8S1_BOTB1|nr:hypothetical protein BOTBODRAFT_48453 [Botryobasidium botryosum FD-172 SS1]
MSPRRARSASVLVAIVAAVALVSDDISARADTSFLIYSRLPLSALHPPVISPYTTLPTIACSPYGFFEPPARKAAHEINSLARFITHQKTVSISKIFDSFWGRLSATVSGRKGWADPKENGKETREVFLAKLNTAAKETFSAISKRLARRMGVFAYDYQAISPPPEPLSNTNNTAGNNNADTTLAPASDQAELLQQHAISTPVPILSSIALAVPTTLYFFLLAGATPTRTKSLTAIATSALSSLICIHDRSVIDHNIKPEIILLTKTGHLKIAHLGLLRDPCGAPEFHSEEPCLNPDRYSRETVSSSAASTLLDPFCVASKRSFQQFAQDPENALSLEVANLHYARLARPSLPPTYYCAPSSRRSSMWQKPRIPSVRPQNAIGAPQAAYKYSPPHRAWLGRNGLAWCRRKQIRVRHTRGMSITSGAMIRIARGLLPSNGQSGMLDK